MSTQFLLAAALVLIVLLALILLLSKLNDRTIKKRRRQQRELIKQYRGRMGDANYQRVLDDVTASGLSSRVISKDAIGGSFMNDPGYISCRNMDSENIVNSVRLL